jgi:hypothetical protein
MKSFAWLLEENVYSHSNVLILFFCYVSWDLKQSQFERSSEVQSSFKIHNIYLCHTFEHFKILLDLFFSIWTRERKESKTFANFQCLFTTVTISNFILLSLSEFWTVEPNISSHRNQLCYFDFLFCIFHSMCLVDSSP